jgi:hypothetical protein
LDNPFEDSQNVYQHSVRLNLRPLSVLAASLIVFFVGCSGEAPTAKVSGTIKFNGELISNGTITFHSDDGSGRFASGTIRDGKYVVENAPVGPTKVQISGGFGENQALQPRGRSSPEGMKQMAAAAMRAQGKEVDLPGKTERARSIPVKYNNPDVSKLTYEVRDDNDQDFSLDLPP